MLKLRPFLQTLALSALAVITASTSLAEERTWTSSDGKSTFKGTLRSASATEIVIVHENGRRFTLSPDKLSKADQAFLKDRPTKEQSGTGLDDGSFSDKLTGEWIKVSAEDGSLLYQIYGDKKKLRRHPEAGIPLFIHLHGAGARANDVEVGKVEIAPQRLISEHFDDHPCILVVPTCPPDVYWGEQVEALELLIDALCAELPIDSSRIYLSGYSMGARGIGSLIESRPDFYAAALFADGEAKMDWVGKVDTALWFTFSGERKLEEAKQVAEAHQAAGKIAVFHGHPDHTHNQIHWTLAKTEGVYDWLFEQILEKK